MEKLFGLEMATIAGALSGMLVFVLISLALLAWRRPVFFKLGLRPIPRRKAQSTLIVLGLMLATLIITAAFITGDTLSYSIRSVAIEGLGEIDELIQVRVASGADGWIPASGPHPAGHPRFSAGRKRDSPQQPAQHRGHGTATAGCQCSFAG
jgi:hypothetical protein